MNTKTFLSIYQTYSLEKISALNKKGLAMQYAQCEQLVKLRKEMAANNKATNKILQNQIKELERQETQRYYKSLAFNINNAIEKIEQENNVDFQSFLCELFLPALMSYSKQAMEILEEISDKEYVKSILAKIQNIQTTSSRNVSYVTSIWKNFLKIQSEAKNKVLSASLDNKEAILSELNDKIQKELSLPSDKKIAKGCLFISAIPLILVILGLVGMIGSGDYEGLDGGIICLAITIVVFALAYIRNKRFQKSEDSQYKSEAHKKLSEEKTAIEDEICEINRQLLEYQTSYNESMQAITLDVPDWEKRISEIGKCLPSIE